MSEIEIEHITPEETSLSTIKTDIQCNIDGCNRTFKSMSVLRFHESQVSNIDGCNRTFKSMSVLQFHESQFHHHQRIKKNMKKNRYIEERFHCPIKDCIYYYSDSTISKYFAKMQYLKQHYLKVHGICSFPCDQCSKSFSTKSYLRAHQLYCDLNIVCSCGQKFNCITSLQTHVKRYEHKADVLDVYSARLGERRLKKTEVPTLQSVFKNTASYGGEGASNIRNIRILPKPQPSHLIAAMALSELAYAELKRAPRVDVGVQTEASSTRRLSRKCLYPPAQSLKSQHLKRKQTTEMETQTQLTNLKSKVRKRGNSRRISKCNIATDTDTFGLESRIISHYDPVIPHSSQNSVLKCDTELENNYKIYNNKDCPELCGNLDGKNLDQNFNSSSTQTTSSVSLEEYVQEVGGLSYHIFRGESKAKECHDQSLQTSFAMVENSLEHQTNEAYSNEVKTNISEKSHENKCFIVNKEDDFDSSSILVDNNEDNLVSISPSGRLSPVLPHRPPSLSSQNRSSSIETQTDCDVFLSNHSQPLDDEGYDIILTSSETQTCENFSDIEPFLCSTIHTQTVDEHHSSNELFPELNSFTSDMQTQTRIDDLPGLVTTHTQTSTFGL